MFEINKIYHGDCLEVMKQFPDNCIDLIVTSPPYDNLRTYKGFTFDFENIAKELFRIINIGGVVVWVVADQTINGSETGTSFKQALYFKEIGFNLHDTMIWVSNSPPCSDKRYFQTFEYNFLFTKEKIKTFNPIMRKRAYKDNRNSKYVNKNKEGNYNKLGYALKTENVKIDNVWRIASGGGISSSDNYAFQHPATFPEKLAKDHIYSWSNEKDLVLDPFCGSGTTCKVALQMNRNYIGIEIAKDYYDLSVKRVNDYKQQIPITFPR